MAFSPHDVVPDSPINNFATLNPLDVSLLGNGRVLENGNLKATHANAGTLVSIGVSRIDNIYFEFNINRLYSVTWGGSIDVKDNNNQKLLTVALRPSEIVFLNPDASVISSTATSAHSTSSVYAFFLTKDSTGGSVSIYRDGTLQASESLATVKDAAFLILKGNGTNTSNATIISYNFGQDPTFAGAKSPTTTYPDANGIGSFYYDPTAIDSEALALCTANLSDFTPDVDDDTPQDYFKAVDYLGDGNSSGATITTDMQPDFVWIKNRDATIAHILFDSVRGVSKVLQSNAFGAEYTDSNTLTDFGSSSFSVGSNDNAINQSGIKYIAWCWKAGGPPDLTTPKPFAKNGVQYETLSAANITAGTITPTAMSVNTDAGFSIVKWTGNGAALVDNTYQSIPTGLSGQLAFAIQKRTNTTGNWHTYHKNCSVAHTYWSAHTYLNSTLGEQIGSGYDSQVFKYTHSNGLCEFQNGDLNNVSGSEYISYFFEEVENYSKFGSYVGNGLADGPFVYCGFRPAWVMIKKYEGGTDRSWLILDSTRDDYNPCDSRLFPNTAAAEFGSEYNSIDILSNGFKPIIASYEANESSGHKYIYAAFSEQPFNYANAR